MLDIVFIPHRSSLRALTTDAQKVFAMLRLIPQEDVARTRPPLALALVVDTSGSMREFAEMDRAKEEIERQGLQGQQTSSGDGSAKAFALDLPSKLDEAMRAAHAIINDSRFEPTDQITIVHFDDTADTLLPLTSLGHPEAAHHAIDSLQQYSGGTHMGKGLQLAQRELAALPASVAKRVILLTDGRAFDEADCRTITQELAANNTAVIAIGIGTTYNQELMVEIANVSRGRAHHLTDTTATALSGILDPEVNQLVKEVITDLQATVATVKGVRLDRLSRVHPGVVDVDLANTPYRLGNIAAGDFTTFVLEFTVSGIARPPSRARIAQVGLVGNAPALGRREEFPLPELFVNFTSDEAAISAVDQTVLDAVRGLNVDAALEGAIRQAASNPEEARRTLQVALGMTQQIGNGAMTRVIERALDELDKTGTVSENTARTVRVGGRTMTVSPGHTMQAQGLPSEEEIRKATGT